MIPGNSTELIWHFAGYLHLTQDFAASRLEYDEIFYKKFSYDYFIALDNPHPSLPDLPEYDGTSIKSNYTPTFDQLHNDVAWTKLHHEYPVVVSLDYVADPYLERAHGGSDPASHAELSYVRISHIIHHHITGYGQPVTQEPREPNYEIKYEGVQADQFSKLTQTNTTVDRDYFSDGSPEYDALHHVGSGGIISAMIDMAKDYNPYPLMPSNESSECWTSTVVAHDQAMAAGEAPVETLTPGRYVNGQLQPEGTPAPTYAVDVKSPALPVREEGSTDPGQVAETGANTAVNAATVVDLNEAPLTLIVQGNFYETNAILQANILQNRDYVFNGEGASASVDSGHSQVDNIATFDVKELVKNSGVHSFGGDLKINVDFADGDVFDVKSLTQHNFLEDGDVTIQTRSDSYSEVHSGKGEQYNVAKFTDWGKSYDIIIVLGDYHSSNIISQTNVVLDNDVVGISSGSGSPSTVFTGQSTLQNQAAIHNYGATAFEGLTGNITSLIKGLSNRDDLDHDAWSSFHGAASGSLDVLFITGNYYDLNIITQVNVIADTDLAVQMTAAGSSLQWLSTGGNVAGNFAEIVNAGGIYSQYLGGGAYEDSILLQANLVSDATHTVATDPTSLVSELVAFMDHGQSDVPTDAATWTKDIFGNHHDTFGHVLI
ncbi:hypothetical protein [Microvirga sp. 2TAF3]|uniref:hypothetical protein n=1 Tax=Microvirga sp. 2TAF3 TaxID=3233014 RepID=UPI003F964E01